MTSTPKASHARPIGRYVKLAVVLAFTALVVAYGCSSPPAPNTVEQTADVVTVPENHDAAALVDPATSQADFTKFTHGNDYHSRLPCLLCHTRTEGVTRPSFPGGDGHLPCAGCHAVQFKENTGPICTICHTETGMKQFPGLKSFGAEFNHGRHRGVSCAVCHKQTGGRGAALTIPAGANAHATCFSCHTSSSTSEMSSCSVCHQPGRLVRTSTSARSFAVSFTHSRHLRGTRMNCNSCHTVMAGSVRGRQVTSPQPSMHFARPGSLSCGGCHNGVKAFGPGEPDNCKRCHQGSTFKF